MRARVLAALMLSLVGCDHSESGSFAGIAPSWNDGRILADATVAGGTDSGQPTDAPGDTAIDVPVDRSAPGCTPRSCQGLGLACGVAPDGCGALLQCGDCPSSSPCECVPRTCAQIGAYACGPQPDGCGGVIECPPCPTDAGLCVPLTCKNYGSACGPQSDGCGGLTPSCGSCPPDQFCGGGGPSQCGPVPAKVCAQLGSNCGMNELCPSLYVDCGTCPLSQYCGTNPYGSPYAPTTCGGVPLDGGDGCIPLTCSALGYECGAADDGCGGTIDCGSCTPPATCGVGGYNHCGTFSAEAGVCQPLTCVDLTNPCGGYADGCGNQTPTCGVGCAGYPIGAPVSCGGGGIPYQCGSGGMCKPVTCAALGFGCGTSGDGCGGQLDCGACPPNEACGAGGYNRCGPATADAGG